MTYELSLLQDVTSSSKIVAIVRILFIALAHVVDANIRNNMIRINLYVTILKNMLIFHGYRFRFFVYVSPFVNRCYVENILLSLFVSAL